MTSSRYDRHFDVAKTKEAESLHCFFVLGLIKLKFGVRGNFRLLISNINSKTQYQFQILNQFQVMPLFFSWIMIFSPALPHELVTMAPMNDLSSIF